MDKLPRGPYVYCLKDPRDGEIFYVGKGRKNRALSHQREIERGLKPKNAKHRRIVAILAAGLSVGIEVQSIHLTDREAYEAERVLIARLGLYKLTNILPGGEVWEEGRRRRIPKPINWKKILWQCMDMFIRVGPIKTQRKLILFLLSFRGVGMVYKRALSELGPSAEKAQLEWARKYYGPVAQSST